MSRFMIHSQQSAPEGSRPLLAGAEQAFGFVPNLLGVFAESPPTLEAYVTLSQLFDKSSFTDSERQVVILTISRFNECRYCIAAHSVIARSQGVPEAAVEAIRTDERIPDTRLEALRAFTSRVLEARGWVSERDVADFLAAGFTNAQVLEVVLGLSLKTLSNYVNHLADTPLDEPFSSQAWEPGAQQRATG